MFRDLLAYVAMAVSEQGEESVSQKKKKDRLNGPRGLANALSVQPRSANRRRCPEPFFSSTAPPAITDNLYTPASTMEQIAMKAAALILSR